MVKLRQEDIKTKEVLSWKGLHLFHFTFSACSMKTRIFLGLKNIDYTGHHINLQKKENFSPFFQISQSRETLIAIDLSLRQSKTKGISCNIVF